MLTKQEFVKKIRQYNPNANFELIKKAYSFSKEAHQFQKRESGAPYFEHPVAVALHLMKLKAGSSTLCAGLLHDVVEDTPVSLADVEREFGKDIAGLVESLTKIDRIYFSEREDYKAENLRKILLATAKDFRVMLVKLCDRLNNMETLQYLPEQRRRAFSLETLQIYAPIAHKLGIWSIKGNLEDLSLKYLEPDIYYQLKNKIAGKRLSREEKTKQIIATINSQLKSFSIRATVKGRAKFFFSIYKKMKEENKKFDEIYDLIAVRIVAQTVQECYGIVRMIHLMWIPNMARYKDYIKTPKPNMYQSIHTTVRVDDLTILEVQIRTRQMHYHAEEGIAAHWRYKQTERDKKFDRKISWLKQLLEWRQDESDEHLVEDLLLDLFRDEIIVFTPKSDPISLPEGATSIDFAYEIHTSIGHSTVQSVVNGKIVPLDQALHSGDVVKIITRKNAVPSRQWLSFVKTHLARNKIRQRLGITLEHKSVSQPMITRSLSHLVAADEKGLIKMARCCTQALGSEIIGYRTKDKKITVHAKTCTNVLSSNPTVAVHWIQGVQKKFIRILIVVEDRVGVLTEILQLVNKFSSTVYSVTTKGHRNNLVIELTAATVFDSEEFRNRVKSLQGFIDLQILQPHL